VDHHANSWHRRKARQDAREAGYMSVAAID
jgi:hypothetical protein